MKSFGGAVAVSVPCGRCIGCRLSKARAMGVRIMHEASLYEPWLNHFATLTFDEDHLPPSRSVDKRDVQLMMKRLRNRVGDGARFMGCGEYGEEGLRPHYHLALMNVDLGVLEPWKRTGSGELVYRSAVLEDVWPFGFAHVGKLTLKSAEYVARYMLKKVSADLAAERYRRVEPETGETWQVEPEFALMSRRPGLGAAWYQRFACDVFPSDFLIVDGHKVPVPKFYKTKLSEAAALRVTAKRKAVARRFAHDNSGARLRVKAEVRRLKAERLKREV